MVERTPRRVLPCEASIITKLGSTYHARPHDARDRALPTLPRTLGAAPHQLVPPGLFCGLLAGRSGPAHRADPRPRRRAARDHGGLAGRRRIPGRRRDGGRALVVRGVGYDAFEFLSTLCNLLAVHGLSIVEGRVFTSRPPPRDRVVSAGSKAPVPPGPGAGPSAVEGAGARPAAQDRRSLPGPAHRRERRRGRTGVDRAPVRAAGTRAAAARRSARRSPSSPDRAGRRGAPAATRRGA